MSVCLDALMSACLTRCTHERVPHHACACQVALPTWEEVSAAGADHAGEFLVGLRAYHPEEYQSFVAERKGSWRTRVSRSQPLDSTGCHRLRFLCLSFAYPFNFLLRWKSCFLTFSR